MSEAEFPVPTEAQQILAELKELREENERIKVAINGLGQNVQWVIDNAKNVFEMFSSPGFMSMIPQMMGGAFNGGPEA